VLLTSRISIAEVHAVFETLYKEVETTMHIDEGHKYRLAVKNLRIIFELFPAIFEEGPLVFLWAILLQDSFIMELKKKEPLALVILAHYATLLHGINEQWWAQGRGRRLVEAVCHILPSPWQPAIHWPKHVVQSTVAFVLDHGN
jgi:hypothetical protein